MILLCQIVSTAFMLVSAYFWIRGNLWMTSQTAKDMSTTKYGGNPIQARYLVSQQCDSVIAFLGLVIGFLIQVWSFYMPNKQIPLIRFWLYGLVIFSISVIVLYLIGNWISRSMEKKKMKGIS